MKNIHEKILHLRSVVPERGATEAEALNAIELAAKLMEKYGVTEEELRKVEFAKDMKSGTVDNQKKSEDPAAKLCSVAIARFCEVKVWGEVEDGKIVTKFFGLNGDVEMAEFLYDVIRKAMDRGWTDYLEAGEYPKKINRHKLYWSYRYGFGDRINDKLNEMVAARKPKDSVTGTDLVVLKEQLVEQAAEQMLALDLKKPRNVGVKLNTTAYKEGMSDGDKVNLNRPLRDQPNNTLLK